MGGRGLCSLSSDLFVMHTHTNPNATLKHIVEHNIFHSLIYRTINHYLPKNKLSTALQLHLLLRR